MLRKFAIASLAFRLLALSVVLIAGAGTASYGRPIPATQEPGNSPETTPPAPAGAPRHAMPKPSNLQVLPKDMSGADVMKVMHSFTGQLGVGCEFCHGIDPATHRPNFASDAKPEKATARLMMHMTADINQKYLTQVVDPDHADHPAPPVGCGTCHRGHSMPAEFTAPPEVEHAH